MEGHTQASGVILRRFREEFGSAESAVAAGLGRDAYELFSEQASRSTAGAAGLLFLPMFNGSTAPILDPYSSGVLLGLRLSHTRTEILRAMMEGICLENRWIFEHMQMQGTRVDTVYFAGGGSRSLFWNQLHADVFQRPVVRVATSNATAVGVAVSTGAAIERYTSVAEGVATLCVLGETYEPQTRLEPLYDGLYDQFQTVYQVLRDADVFRTLRHIANEQQL
jgi:sugar (pentulose or hexulose) kinase